MMIVLMVLCAAAVLAVLFSGYVKASPDKAYIISGFRKKTEGIDW